VLIVKSKSLKNDLVESRNHLSNFSCEKLQKLLHVQKHSSDRSGLGFDKTAHMYSNLASTPKTRLGHRSVSTRIGSKKTLTAQKSVNSSTYSNKLLFCHRP
jgi:hypothetical protein